MIRRVALIALCAAIALSLSGCIVITGGSGSAKSLKSNEASKAAETPRAPRLSQVGEEVSAGAWRVTVEDVSRAKKLPNGKKAGKGKEYLLIDVGFRNAGSPPLVVKSKSFTLVDSKGKTLSKAKGVPPAFNAKSVRPVLYGYGTSTVFAYTVPKDSSGYIFTFAPKVAGEKKPMSWAVK